MTPNIQIGDYIYIQYGDKKVLRKITWIGSVYFEWRFGYDEWKNINHNTDKNSRVKWTLKHY